MKILLRSILLWIALSSFCAPSFAERPGDTIELTTVFLDTLGVAVRPTSATAYVFRNNTAIDSTSTIANGKITSYRTKLLKWKYTIPTIVHDSTRYAFYVRASWATITDDWVAANPREVLVHGGTIDSLSRASVVDLWSGMQSSLFGTIDSMGSGIDSLDHGGGIYRVGAPVTGAFVFVTAESSLVNPITMGLSFGGDYEMWVPLNPTGLDTLFISAWYQNSWLKRWKRVIL